MQPVLPVELLLHLVELGLLGGNDVALRLDFSLLGAAFDLKLLQFGKLNAGLRDVEFGAANVKSIQHCEHLASFDLAALIDKQFVNYRYSAVGWAVDGAYPAERLYPSAGGNAGGRGCGRDRMGHKHLMHEKSRHSYYQNRRKSGADGSFRCQAANIS